MSVLPDIGVQPAVLGGPSRRIFSLHSVDADLVAWAASSCGLRQNTQFAAGD